MNRNFEKTALYYATERELEKSEINSLNMNLGKSVYSGSGSLIKLFP